MIEVGPFRMIKHQFVVAGEAAVVAEISRVLQSLAVPPSGGHLIRYEIVELAGRYDVTVDGRQLRTASDGRGAVDVVLTEANRRAIESSVVPAVLHAGAVARDGRALVVAGESGTGKSTLVSRLVQSGTWAYLTDEAVRLTEHGTVLPYNKPLVEKRSKSVPRRHVAPEELGTNATEETPVAAVLLLGVEAPTPGRALYEACRLAFSVNNVIETVDALAGLVRSVPVRCLPARPNENLADATIADLWSAGQGFDRPDVWLPSTADTQGIGDQPEGRMATAESVGGQFVGVRPAHVHVVAVDDELVLLHRETGEMRLLDPNGALVWRCLDGTSRLVDIAADIAQLTDFERPVVNGHLVDMVSDLASCGLVQSAAR